MQKTHLFIDGSSHPQSKIGYGAMLLIKDKNQPKETLQSQVKVKRFESTSSTKLELQTLLWAFAEIGTMNSHVIVYTDSQNILSLPLRRERFEKNGYMTKSKELIKNHQLYKEFFKLTDIHNIELIKVKGHQVSNLKTDIDNIFTIVDRASRKALRNKVI